MFQEVSSTTTAVKQLNAPESLFRTVRSTTGEDRKILAQSLFDEISYDLDRKRIVDFKIKSWAEPFLVLRAALYQDDMGRNEKPLQQRRFKQSIVSWP